MIDENKVMAVAERAIFIGAGKEQLFTADEIQALSLMLREAERDAARYRWLRENASLENHGGFEYDLPLIHAIRYMYGAEPNQEMTFDEAIDQAMKEKGDE